MCSNLMVRERVILFKVPSSTLLNRKQDLSKFMHMPKAPQKVSRITLKAAHSSHVPKPYRITSSTKRRCVRESWCEILIPLIKPFLRASSIRRLSPSITRINSRGDRGHPCLIPREAVKNL